MRVVISGTHGSGKSTLIGDFAAAHREWAILPEPIEIGADEDLELREAMDLSLLELADDPDLAGRRASWRSPGIMLGGWPVSRAR